METHINKVLVFGIGNGCSRIEKILNENVDIIAYIDNIIVDFNTSLYVKNDEAGMKRVFTDSNKNYPKIVEENKKIFGNYLSMLYSYYIKPIMVICSMSKYYSKHFPQKMIVDFYEILNYVKKKYNFQILDYFNWNLFYENDFSDVTHLNNRGAEKFTSMLDREIRWDIRGEV